MSLENFKICWIKECGLLGEEKRELIKSGEKRRMDVERDERKSRKSVRDVSIKKNQFSFLQK